MKKCSSKAFGLMIGDFQSNALKSREVPRDQSPNPGHLVPNVNRANRFTGPKVQIRSKSTFAQKKANQLLNEKNQEGGPTDKVIVAQEEMPFVLKQNGSQINAAVPKKDGASAELENGNHDPREENKETSKQTPE